MPTACLALACFAGGSILGRDPGLRADSQTSNDIDSDGLSDALELILGTDPISADSDSDGFGDLEELARQSDPLITTQSLGGEAISTIVLGRAVGGVLHAHVPVYIQGSNFAGIALELGFFISGVRIPLPPNVYLPASTVTLHPGAVPGDLIAMLDISIPQSFVESLPTSLALYALTTPAGASAPTVASALNVFAANGILLAIQPTGGGQGFGGGGQGGGSTTPVVETVYRPISDTDEVPSSYSEGKICSQTSETVGSVGLMLQQQVTSANCDDADAFCASDCTLNVGKILEVLDRLVLIGG